jgi:hypothetical protein
LKQIRQLDIAPGWTAISWERFFYHALVVGFLGEIAVKADDAVSFEGHSVA